MSNNNLPIVFGLVGFGILTLIGGSLYFRKTGKEWIRESQAYDKAVEDEVREKQSRLTEQVDDYDPDYADEEGLFGSSSSDSDEKISDLFLRNGSDRESFGGSRKKRKGKKRSSKRRRREKLRHTVKKRGQKSMKALSRK